MYVIARAHNNRPTLQHEVSISNSTSCGLDISTWRRAYQNSPIPELLCKRCNSRTQVRHLRVAR
jgi:hypothetical protein